MIHPSWLAQRPVQIVQAVDLKIEDPQGGGRSATRNSAESLCRWIVCGMETRRASTRVPIPGPLANADESRRNSRRAHENRPPFLFLTSGSVDITCQSVGLPLWTNRFLDDILLDTTSRRVTFVLTRGFIPFLCLFFERNFLSRTSHIISSTIVEYSRCFDCYAKVEWEKVE